ncbi:MULTISPECIES: hypothetical protein [unclassified Haematospirillum]|uniref:hypothetical protein n=1 Tax=unclassified Haematospirillum TaxID=2622088 RepID=UPI00143ACFD9|nr:MULTISPECIES: hypothetical protein [unclassified Haematospirillum]NKD55148.1 hypothetical protein [Haematospirillum sp. H4890]NKD75401.1 hypothetical protein [Haematospirillum sp. H4485]
MSEVTLREIRGWCGQTGREIRIDSVGRLFTSGRDRGGVQEPHSLDSLTATILGELANTEKSKDRLSRLSGLLVYLQDELKKEGIACDIAVSDPPPAPGNDNERVALHLGTQSS